MTVKWNGEALARRVRQAAVQGVFAGTAIVDNASVENITTGPKTGRIYKRNGVSHQASAPGQSPASDTGRLLSSRRSDFEEQGLVGRVSYNTAYARRLELGDEKLAPRPYLQKALEDNRSEVEEAIQAPIRDVLK